MLLVYCVLEYHGTNAGSKALDIQELTSHAVDDYDSDSTNM